MRHVGEHNHEGNAANVEVAKLYGELKRRSADTMEGPAQILQQTTANLSEAVKGKLPTKDALSKVVRRVRR